MPVTGVLNVLNGYNANISRRIKNKTETGGAMLFQKME